MRLAECEGKVVAPNGRCNSFACMRARKWILFIPPHVLSLVRHEVHNAECRLCQLEEQAACQPVIYGALDWVVSVVNRIWQLEWGEKEESIFFISFYFLYKQFGRLASDCVRLDASGAYVRRNAQRHLV